MKMLSALQQFWLDESGGETVEWPLVIGLVAVGAVAGWTLLGTQVTAIVGKITAALTTPAAP